MLQGAKEGEKKYCGVKKILGRGRPRSLKEEWKKESPSLGRMDHERKRRTKRPQGEEE